jgi:hypothetical protein
VACVFSSCARQRWSWLSQWFGGVEMAHLPVSMFLLTKVQWRLHDWIVVLATLLGAQYWFYCTLLPA